MPKAHLVWVAKQINWTPPQDIHADDKWFIISHYKWIATVVSKLTKVAFLFIFHYQVMWCQFSRSKGVKFSKGRYVQTVDSCQCLLKHFFFYWHLLVSVVSLIECHRFNRKFKWAYTMLLQEPQSTDPQKKLYTPWCSLANSVGQV